ncbi:response regulator [Vannielia sp. SX4]|uniref:response regulator n=1 Tax=Vannielia sp. SX4 TaxID=3463852 RepID=UPI004059D8B2
MHVDDDADIRAIAEVALAVVGGLEIMQCASGKEAVERAAGFKPDLFLLDVMMPEMSGEQTFVELRRQPGLQNVPTVFLTAKSLPDDVAHLIELGGLKVIPKPFDPLTLASEVVGVWQSANEA